MLKQVARVHADAASLQSLDDIQAACIRTARHPSD